MLCRRIRRDIAEKGPGFGRAAAASMREQARPFSNGMRVRRERRSFEPPIGILSGCCPPPETALIAGSYLRVGCARTIITPSKHAYRV
jgi:hypothetical protein